MPPKLHVVLFQPEIPQNTGNIGRLCAIAQLRLHLIHPFGFKITDRNLKRSGMDYWQSLDWHQHESWEAFQASPRKPERLWLFTTKAQDSFWDASFSEGDGLVFGNEGGGAPAWLHEQIGDTRRVKIPQFTENLRSLNLATSVGIACYEALRQIT